MSIYTKRKFSLVQHSTGKQFKVGGYRPDPEDQNDKKYGAGRYRAENLPLKVDLRPYLTPVEQQGELNSCTANAMAGAYEYLAMRQLGTSGDVSRLFIYYNARHLDGATDQDEGTYLRSCIKSLRKLGACLEQTWPYNPNTVFQQPHSEAYQEAASFLVDDAERIDVNLYTMRHCLAEGYPFAFGLQLFSSFDKADANGRVPMPDPDSEEHQGGHAMLCVGYSEKDRVFVVRNSWGSDWGDKGYCYIPYDYMANPDLNSDCWTIRGVTDLDFSEGTWGNDSSFFDEIIPLIADMLSIEDDPQNSVEEYYESEADEDEYDQGDDSEENADEYDNSESGEDEYDQEDDSEEDADEYDESESAEDEYDDVKDEYDQEDDSEEDEAERDQEYDDSEEDDNYQAEPR